MHTRKNEFSFFVGSRINKSSYISGDVVVDVIIVRHSFRHNVLGLEMQQQPEVLNDVEPICVKTTACSGEIILIIRRFAIYKQMQYDFAYSNESPFSSTAEPINFSSVLERTDGHLNRAMSAQSDFSHFFGVWANWEWQ